MLKIDIKKYLYGPGTVTAIVLFSVFLFWLNHLAPLMPGDDYLYSLKIPSDDYLGSEVIRSPRDYFESIINHYRNYNYRIFPHALLQLILLFPPWVFDILNTAVFLVIAWQLLKFRKWDRVHSGPGYLVILLFLFLFHFDLGRSYFWTTGSLNYSWMLIPQLALLYLFIQRVSVQFPGKSAGLLLLSLICCTSNENVVLSLFLTGIIVWIYRYLKYQKADWMLFLSILILLAGGILMLMSPALGMRLDMEGEAFDPGGYKLAEYARRFVYYFFRYAAVLLLIPIYGLSKKRLKAEQWIMLFTVFCSAAVMYAAPLYEPRSAVFGFMVMIAIVLMQCKPTLKRPWILGVLVLASVWAGIERIPSFKTVNQLHNNNLEILKAQAGSSDTVFLRRFCPGTNLSAVMCDEISEDPEYMDNRPLAAYFGINKVALADAYSGANRNKRFEKELKGGNFEYDSSVPFGKTLYKDIEGREYYLNKEDGLSIALRTNKSMHADSLILILRGSRRGLNRYRLIDGLPVSLRLYFLDYLEYPTLPVDYNGELYFYNHVFFPGDYKYFLISLYDPDQHAPLGRVIRIDP